MKKFWLIIICLFCFVGPTSAGYENPQTYDETDVGNVITIDSATKVSWVDIDRDEARHVSDSKGAAHFGGDFAHKFECYYENEAGASLVVHWQLANSQTDWAAQITNTEDFVLFYVFGSDDDCYVRVYENGVSIDDDMWGDFNTGTLWFITATRTDATKTYVFDIRDDGHAEPIHDTLTIVANNALDFEHVFFVNSYHDDNANPIDGYTQNLDLQEAAPGPPEPTGVLHDAGIGGGVGSGIGKGIGR